MSVYLRYDPQSARPAFKPFSHNIYTPTINPAINPAINIVINPAINIVIKPYYQPRHLTPSSNLVI